MQYPERHVLTANEPMAVKRVLDALSSGLQFDGGLRPETRRGLEEFSKQGFSRMILNLQVMDAPFTRMPAAFNELRACRVGEVLVVTGQVTPPRMHQVEELCHRPFFPRRLASGVQAFASRAIAGIESGVRRFARAVRRAG